MGKYDRYKNLATLALKNYDIDVLGVTFLVEETNVFFEVITKDNKYVLKVFQEESSKLEDNLIEVFFLDEITKRTNLIVPSVLHSKTGKAITFVYDETEKLEKRFCVYNFLEGVDIDGFETIENIVELGKATAILHKASKEISIPISMKPKRWDNVFYYRDEEVLYNTEEYKQYYKKEDIQLLDKLIKYVNEKLQHYYLCETFLLHADLNPWNVKLENGKIRLFDFEEGMIGSFIHEIAIFLFYYKYDERDNYEDMKNAFIKGYSEILDVPKFDEFDIELLMIARRLNFINYILMINDSPNDYIELNMKRIKEFCLKYDLHF